VSERIAADGDNAALLTWGATCLAVARLATNHYGAVTKRIFYLASRGELQLKACLIRHLGRAFFRRHPG
jgi:hypothetical protein